MKRHSSLNPSLVLCSFLLIAAGMIGAVPPLAAQSESSSSETGLKVGVVDIREVYRSYKRTAQFSQKFMKQKKEAEKKMKSLSKEMKQIQKELNELEPLSDLWKKRAKKYYELESKKKLMKDLWKQDTQKSLGETTAQIYDSIREVIQDYAREHNYDLILKVNQSDINKQKMSRVNEQIATRSVLYFDDAMDLTDRMIEILNDEYTAKNEEDGSSSSENEDE